MDTRTTLRATLPVVAAALVLSACSGSSDDAEDAGEALTVYVGRDEELVSPLIEQFTEETGIEVDARYGDTPELAATLLDEGDATPADVFLSQDAGALGALSAEGLLTELDDDLTENVKADYSSTDGTWIGVTGRARVIAYDSEELDADDVPDSVKDFTDDEWEGRVGFPPGNASFQAFVTGFRVAEGDEAARAWLDGMADNDHQSYERNSEVLEAVNAGQLDIGLINHYYWFQSAAESGEDEMRAQLKFAEAGDPGALVNVTGAGVLSDHPDAQAFMEYLVSEAGQTYFVENTYEYPLIDGVDAPEGLPTLEELQGPDIDLSDLADLETSVTMIEESGLS
ncbi:iron ABC transporter substrate-binding protein [Aeromicrobium sp. CTD01-1L150]|uniref:iron ABC transporter substrate-binding protein n=1 Tax=Aeromicrobium sp. CTD01-1L150 TaxID=3341830 RepID=UPI0035C1697D